MLISHRYHFVFLATPHAGSSSVRHFLSPYCEVIGTHRSLVTPQQPFHHHMSAAAAHRCFRERGWEWDSYRHFCIVRNPFDRVVSMYHFHKKFNWVYGAGALTNVRRYINQRRFSWGSFRRFVLRLDASTQPNIRMKRFACDANGIPLVEDVLRFESLTASLPPYIASLGVPPPEGPLPHLNATESRRQYRDYYDDETRAHVERLFDYEISRFGYQF